MNFLLIDYETRSRADLPSCGQHIYSRHPSTEIMCLGWKVIGEKGVNLLSTPGIYTDDASETTDFYHALKHCDYVVAHNAPFEQAIYSNVHLLTTPMGAKLPLMGPEKYICTLSMTNVLALPRSLEGAGNALDLEIKKDTGAKKLLLSMCKPKRPINEIKKWIEWNESPWALETLYDYCKTDVLSEEVLFKRLHSLNPFTKKERDLWILDQKINQRGFSVDIDMVKNVLRLIGEEENELTADLRRLTFGWVKSAKSTKALREFLADQGFDLENAQKKTIDDAVLEIEKGKREADRDVLEVLRIRQNLGMSSTSKYNAFLDRHDPIDLKVRDNLMFHGASTGRWSGTGVQPQNFPRGMMKIGDFELSLLKDHSVSIDDIRMLYKKPMGLFSSALRSMIKASPGKELFSGDFSAIEARVLLWVAGDTAGLEEYRQSKDVYISMASTIYGDSYDEIMAEYKKNDFSERRQLGKKVILACGYQMGVKKFSRTCKDEGLLLPESLIAQAHAAFRKKYPLVAKVWTNYELAAIHAVKNPGKVFKINKVEWFLKDDFLWARLPSGRKLSYYKPSAVNTSTAWGQDRPQLYHWSVDPITKQWTNAATYGGKLTENIVSAISRDLTAESMTKLENAGYDVIFSVHDENVSEREIGAGNLEEFKRLMTEAPSWAEGLPIKVGAWSGPRYRK